MAHAQASINLNRAGLDVFNFLADGLNNPKWRSGIIEIQKITPGDIAVGTRYMQRMKGPMGRTIHGDYEITVFEPGQILGFRVIAGPVRPEGRFMIGGDGEETSVQFDLQCPPKTFFQKFLDGRVQKVMEQEVAAIANLQPLLDRPRTESGE